MSRLVVMGTGTGVGKTHVSTALGRTLERTQPERRIALLKPVETGLVEGQPSDAQRLEAATHGFARPDPHPCFAFEPAISPHLAARRSGVRIELAEVIAWVERFEARERPHARDLVVIETAGGVFTPLGEGVTNLDLARALEPALWLLVAPDALGVLHELTATLAAMTARARAPDLIALSAARAPDASTGSNADELRRLGIADPILCLRAGSDDATPLLARLTR